MTDVAEIEQESPYRKTLQEFLGNYKPIYADVPEDIDTLSGRFKILTQNPLPELGHELAYAYAARDNLNEDKDLYALVLDGSMPYRTKAVELLANISHPNLQVVLGHGNIPLSIDKKRHQVIFLERPTGAKLSSILQTGQRMHEHQVIDRVLNPALRALLQLKEKELGHGSLNPDKIYVGETTIIAEAFSSPYGYFQDYLYEPLERVMAHHFARGTGDERNDVYALAVIAFEMLYSIDSLRKLGQEDFISQALKIGTYHLFSQNVELSDNMSDFFRGAMSDNIEERWTLEQFQQWLGGKRYNMIVPPTPKDASRPINFIGVDYFSKRALAHTFHKNWRTTLKELWELKVDRWLEMSMHRPDLADQVERILRQGGKNGTPQNNADVLTRLISVLDPLGPIRTQNLSLRPEGIGLLLANLFRQGFPNETQELAYLIEQDVPNYWAYLTESHKSHELSQILWKVQRVKSYAKIKGMGFGIERLLYEFNDTLPCQAEMLKGYNAQSFQDILQALDTLAPRLAKTHSFVDRHLAAFIACKLDIGKEIRIQDVTIIPDLVTNPELVVMRLLGRAQQKVGGKARYIGLSAWAALRVEEMLDCIHNRSIRKKLKSRLKSAAASGNINEVLGVLINREAIVQDQDGFHRALAQYTRNYKMMQDLKNTKRTQKLAQLLGSRLSSAIGYIILIASFYYIAGTI